ncbi:MAG: exodeoxyribonuclease III [Actinomycetota bacterium]
MRIASWNVNSLNARLPRVEEWLERMQPDVVCMQETKLEQDAFPTDAFTALGYESVHYGEGRWNGVAILSRVGLDDVVVGFEDGQEKYEESRAVWATCGGVRLASLYIPNGREVDHDHYHYKLEWLGRLRAHLDANHDPATPLALLGDFNIAPEDNDVWDRKAFEGKTHVTEAERTALDQVKAWGLTDTFRHLYPEADGLFTYYDYTAGRFHKRQGIRIDLILATDSLLSAVQGALVDRNGRKAHDGNKPSDHVPLYADFDI